MSDDALHNPYPARPPRPFRPVELALEDSEFRPMHRWRTKMLVRHRGTGWRGAVKGISLPEHQDRGCYCYLSVLWMHEGKTWCTRVWEGDLEPAGDDETLH